MTNITYLLGAGASANALPVIKKNPETDKPGLSEELLNFVGFETSTILNKNDHWSSNQIEHLKDIAKKCMEFGTPDLYCKFLLETGDINTYKILKNLLSTYLMHTQIASQAFDYRALTFLTTITTNKKIPENIRIISWNYDIQIELAAAKLKPTNPSGYELVQGFTSWPNLQDSNYNELPFLVHLNGVAGYNYSEKTLSTEIKHYYDLQSSLKNELLLSFAWETEQISSNRTFLDNIVKLANKISSKTNILVVIGYSFPFFNRNIDKEIISNMKQSLKKIYFQDPFDDGSRIINLFDFSDEVKKNFVHVKHKDNYHIPYELE